MNANRVSTLLRNLPPIDKLLQEEAAVQLSAQTSRERVRDWLRDVLEELRAELPSRAGLQERAALLDEIFSRLRQRHQESVKPRLRRVINATGVIVHTNLGRAPLPDAAIEAIERTARCYTNLEYDLERGERGKRDRLIEDLLTDLLDAESAMVVNNNAAAVLLALNTLAFGSEVVVSRGELVEIGGGFRVPEVMAKSGALLREAGTTNKTRAADYRRAINERTRALLRVHPSNFRVVGFTERPSLEELVEVAHEANLPLFEDLGSGCLIPLDTFGLSDESPARLSLKAGVDVISFSGDKLLGGPQCGVLAGRRDLIKAMRENPLTRALRADKLTYAALEATLRSYASGRAAADVPVLRMIALPVDEIRTRTASFIVSLLSKCGSKLSAEAIHGVSVAGGGSAPGETLPTFLVAISHQRLSPDDLLRRLRFADPPVIARIEEDRLVLDLRTVTRDEELEILAAFSKIA